MIPKIIHYCWFGNGEKSKSMIDCINSWKKYLPDYEIIEWNETNFDVNICEFTSRAYRDRKWAFVADYARLKALDEIGGIYLDTDVQFVRPLDEKFLEKKMFTCFEDEEHISTCLIGAEKGFGVIKDFLKYYDTVELAEGKFKSKPNTEILKQMLFGDNPVDVSTNTEVNGVSLYTSDYFQAKNFENGKIRTTANTYCIHHYNGTWKGPLDVFKDKIKLMIKRIIGKKNYIRLKRKYKK